MLTILGLFMMAGHIFCTVFTLGGWRDAPKWLTITAGVLSIIFFIGVISMTIDA